MTRSAKVTTPTNNNIIHLLLLLLLSHLLLSTNSLPLTFSDGNNHTITQNYTNTNVFLLNGTTLLLAQHATIISAPPSSSDAEEAIRVENSIFIGQGGIIVGGEGVGGTGVTVTTNKESDQVSSATFEGGIEVYGGSAGRESTTRGGNAVQILQVGSEVTFYGGKFVPGTGCTRDVCGVPTDDGNSIQLLYGKAIIKGGTFEGNIYSVSGVVEVHGCVEFDGERISGFLLDGSRMDVVYVGDVNDLDIVYDASVCQEELTDVEEPSDSSATPSNANARFNAFARITRMSFSLRSLLLISALGMIP
ncbi:hypothetical protein HJC23_013731 [Cyclotella cryptica]|uniref:Uncharacterized protein n=1 Tax=Cyclotella cryptica TaxID=29204 RepID=A0ABD3PID0_9STRA